MTSEQWVLQMCLQDTLQYFNINNFRVSTTAAAAKIVACGLLYMWLYKNIFRPCLEDR